MKPGGLTYEPRIPFESVVGLDFGNGSKVYTERSRRLKSIHAFVGCNSIEPGDTVAIDDPKSGGKAKHPGQFSQRHHLFGTVMSTNPKTSSVVVTRTRDGNAITEKHDMARCHRQAELFSVWTGPSDPIIKPHTTSLGLISESVCYKHKMEAVRAKAKWSHEAISRYKDSNLKLIATALAECTVGTTGVIYRHRLEECLVQLEAIPDVPAIRKIQLDKIIYVFGCSLKAHQLQDIISPNIPGDAVEIVAFEDILGYLDTLVNGDAGAAYFAQRCFDLYVHDGRGYIHREKLREWRRWRAQEHSRLRESGCNSFQVKVLLELFSRLHRAEEMSFLAAGKGKKGPDPPPPPPGSAPALPKLYTLRRHINLEEFSEFLKTDTQLVLAFLPVALMCLKEDVSLGGKLNFVPSTRARIPEKLHRTYSEFFITSGKQRSREIL